MSSQPNKTKTRKRLSKADLKAYESRRAAERHRVALTTPNPVAPADSAHVASEHSFAMTRDEEYRVIKSDLVRLIIILAILLAVLVVLTFILR